MQRGFSYVVMLFALAIFGVGLAALGQSWSGAAHRDKEEELVQIGKEYVRAIGSYNARSPGSVKSYPKRLEELVDDQRFVGTERHLRKLYRDPFTNDHQWGLVRSADHGIIGVYSLSDKETLNKQALLLPDAAPVSGARYFNWKFIHQPPQTAP